MTSYIDAVKSNVTPVFAAYTFPCNVNFRSFVAKLSFKIDLQNVLTDNGAISLPAGLEYTVSP